MVAKAPISRQTPIEELPDLMTYTEVAYFMGVTADTVKRWVSKGKLKKVHSPGGRPRVQRDELKALIGRVVA